MRLRQEEIQALAKHVAQEIKAGEGFSSLVNESILQAEIAGVIVRNLKAEEEIDNLARQLMEEHRAEMKQVDPQKAYMMIKKQIAKEKKFVL